MDRKALSDIGRKKRVSGQRKQTDVTFLRGRKIKRYQFTFIHEATQARVDHVRHDFLFRTHTVHTHNVLWSE
ncbi:MAG: hypothetical protein MJH10_01330 [Epibacterium sp.]|nr:hypothetical protein [Epibacterium sp.]NQX72202.1 hypothetical protein [Epibacterium sp.]